MLPAGERAGEFIPPPGVEAQVQRPATELVRRQLRHRIHQRDRFHQPRPVEAVVRQHRLEVLAVIQRDLHVPGREPQAIQHVDGRGDDPRVGAGIVLADDVQVPLEVLSQPPALGALGPKE